MLRVVLGRGAGETAWTHGDGSAAGALRVAPEHVHDALGLRLGAPPRRPLIQRVIRCARTLAAVPGPWSESLASAPLSTAQSLLREADALALHGARADDLPAALSARLSAAWESDSPDAFLNTVAAAAGDSSLRGDITLSHDPAELPRGARDLLDALARQGWTVREARRDGFTPDVLHLRDRTPVALAQRLAAALAREAPASTVVIAPTPSLAMAFAQHALPSLGDPPRDDRTASLLRALLALARAPEDVARVRALVDHPLVPLPYALHRALLDALMQWPSHRASAWAEALRRAPDGAEAAHALRALCEATSRTLDDVIARWRAFARWMEAAPGASPDGARAVGAYVDLLARLGINDLDASIVDDAARLCLSDFRSTPRSLPEAGAAALQHPGGVLGPVDHLVVWNASSFAPPEDPLDALDDAVRAALRARGLALPTASQRRRAHLDDLLRAIARTRARVWLCDAETDEDGSPSHEGSTVAWLDATLRARGGAGVRPYAPPPSACPVARPAPHARRRWRAIPPLRARTESPSSLAALLGCSLRHALRYGARLRDDLHAPLPEGPLLYGRIAHEVLAASLLPRDDAATTRARTEARFDAFVAVHAPALSLPAQRPSRHHLRATTARAGALLATALEGVEGVRTEELLRPAEPFGPVRLQGRADLIARAPAMVLDLKWSASDHARALAEGTALQLALYAWALRGGGGGAWPAVGYVILDDAEVFVTAPSPLPRARAVPGVAVARTVDAALRALSEVAASRDAGTLVAEGIGDDGVAPPRGDALDGDRLRVAPGCRYCAFDGLCGRAWEVAR